MVLLTILGFTLTVLVDSISTQPGKFFNREQPTPTPTIVSVVVDSVH